MIKHIVFLAFAENIADAQIQQTLTKLGNLRHKEIPQIKSFSAGKNISPEQLSHGFNYVFTMEFANEKDRDMYLANEAHQLIAKNEILPLLANGINSAIIIDYKV